MDFRVRFVERPLGENKLAEQTAAIRCNSSIRDIRITNTGLAMMASIVGKRIPKYLKDHIGDALNDTISGNFDDDGETEGDVFASVYGEILGPLFTCLERDGDFTIIRLVRSQNTNGQGKRADLLLVDSSSGLIMLQECKGHCSDYYSVEEQPDSFDICQKMRELRNKAKRDQMVWPSPDQISSRRVRVSGRGTRIALPFPHAERSVVVTAVPDGRTAMPSFNPNPPPHENCDESCKSCFFDGGPTLITVLSTEGVQNNARLGPDGMKFIDWYKACERAIWGSAHGSFGKAYSSLLGVWMHMETSTGAQRKSIPLLTGLVEEAINRKVYVDFHPIFGTSENVRMPDDLMTRLKELHYIQGDIQPPHIREGSPREIG